MKYILQTQVSAYIPGVWTKILKELGLFFKESVSGHLCPIRSEIEIESFEHLHALIQRARFNIQINAQLDEAPTIIILDGVLAEMK